VTRARAGEERPRRSRPRSVRVAALVLAAALAAAGGAAAAPPPPDVGDLILLDVYGSYEEMGEQVATLLGEDGRRVLQLHLDYYERSRPRGVSGWLFDRVVLPLAGWWMSDASGAMDEGRGMARALGISHADLLRAQVGANEAGGSTVFVATRSATADGHALVGRNVDWTDLDGRLRPTVVRYHPEGEGEGEDGDLSYASAGWPLLLLPTVGVNEAGLAFSFNYFATDPQMAPTATAYPHRRVLQRAHSVDEAIAIFQSEFPLVISTFGALADASGDIALLECTTERCEVFRPEGDWFAHSNHARTESMQEEDLYRGPDSLDRRRLMEEAVERHLGELDVARAVEILRDRGGHPYPNASVVGNLFVLNAAVVEPAKRTLWHSDRMEPYAPFGRFVPIPVGDAPAPGDPIPASPFLETDAYRREAAAVARVRAAQNADDIDRDLARANALWAEIFADPPPELDASRLALGWGLSLVAAGRFDQCLSELAAQVGEGADRQTRVAAALLAGVCSDGLGRRGEATAHYRWAQALMQEVPSYTSYGPMRAMAAAGLERPLGPHDVHLSWWLTHVPR
jgi:hypothetical protein